MQTGLKCLSGPRTQHARLGSRRMQAVPDSPAAQHTDTRIEQAAYIQRLRQEAFEAGFKAGYQKGVQVQVSVSVDLQDEDGSYLRRRGRDGTGSSRTSSSSSADSKQPPGVRARKSLSAAATPSTSTESSSQGTAPPPPAASGAAGDSVARSAVKGLVWRVFSTSATVTVALVLFQDSLQVSDALEFGGIEFATKYVMYFLHERLWAAVALL